MSWLRGVAYDLALRGMGWWYPHIRQARELLARADAADARTYAAMREEAFGRQIDFLWKEIPYYRRVMEERGLTPASFASTADVVKLPVLNRERLRAAGDTIRSTGIFPEEQILVRRSGGTTGEPIASRIDPFARALETYAFLRGLEWMGWQPGMSIVWLTGGSLGAPAPLRYRERLKRAVTGGTFLPAFEIRAETAERYCEAIAAAGPCVVVGYASALLQLATHAPAHRKHRLDVRRVFSTAELLPPDWQEKIEQGLNAEVRSYYGCGEVNTLGFQVERAGPYVLPDEHVLLESVPAGTDGVAAADDTLLVTTLYNRAQPLVRYAIGDRGKLLAPGVAHPTRGAIAELLGRASDLFLRVDGTAVSGSMGPHLVFATKLPVRRYQFVQTRPDRIEFRYEADAAGVPAEKLREVERILRDHLGAELEVVFSPTTDFEVTRAGKHRVVIQKPAG
jgi:phenylacetate-CoA ligase